MLSALLLVAATALGTPAHAPSSVLTHIERAPRYATFVPVCRDARGAWDRRACRHVAHRDPHRIVLVARDNQSLSPIG